jgi:hypothetical protein
MEGLATAATLLSTAPCLSRFRELDPLAGDSKPRLFIERAYRLFSVLPGFLSLLAKPGCFVAGQVNYGSAAQSHEAQ